MNTAVKIIVLLIFYGASLQVWSEQDFEFTGLGETPGFEELAMPVVLTATRIQQHQADVPASVTILDSELIKQLGVTSLSELLRFVPGMMVGPDRNNNSDAVHYHGGPAAFPKNLQVLVNGRSMYRSVVAAVSWFEMPVALEDISRIEIVRGPNAASYGSNAYQAVINILTKHPADTYGSTVSVKKGNNGEKNVYLKDGGTLGETDYRVSFSQRSDDGFEDQNDSRIVKFIDFESNRVLDSGGELDLSLVYVNAKKELADQVDDDLQVNQNERSESRLELGGRWVKDLSAKHQIQIRSYATQYNQRQVIEVEGMPVARLDDNLRELFKINPDGADALITSLDTSLIDTADPIQLALLQAILSNYPNPAVDGVVPVNGTINADMDEYRFDVEVQDTFIYSPQLTLVSGASLRRDAVDSQTYLGGRLNNNTARIFGSATWQASDSINLHLGVMTEKESSADFVYAPRVALNYKLTPSQSLRTVYSESVRSPDLFEQQADWSFTLDNPQSDATLNGTTFYQTQQGPNNLEHQFIESYEIGYYGKLVWLGLESDVRIFHEHLADYFYQSLKLRDLSTDRELSIRFEGVEWMLNITPWDNGQIRWNAALVEATSNAESNNKEIVLLRIYAQTTTTLSWLQSWPMQMHSSVTYMKADKLNQLNDDIGGRYLFERIDGRLAKTVNIGRYDLEVSASFQHDLSSNPYVQPESVYEDKSRIQFGVSLNF